MQDNADSPAKPLLHKGQRMVFLYQEMNPFGHNAKSMKPRAVPGVKIPLYECVCVCVWAGAVISKACFRSRRRARRRSKGNQGLR